MKVEARGKQKAGKGTDGSGGRGRKKNLPQQITEENRTDRETSVTLARAAGSNRAYVEAAAKLTDTKLEAPRTAPYCDSGGMNGSKHLDGRRPSQGRIEGFSGV